MHFFQDIYPRLSFVSTLKAIMKRSRGTQLSNRLRTINIPGAKIYRAIQTCAVRFVSFINRPFNFPAVNQVTRLNWPAKAKPNRAGKMLRNDGRILRSCKKNLVKLSKEIDRSLLDLLESVIRFTANTVHRNGLHDDFIGR